MYEIYLGVNCANFENFDQTKMEGFGYFPTDIRKLGKLGVTCTTFDKRLHNPRNISSEMEGGYKPVTTVQTNNKSDINQQLVN